MELQKACSENDIDTVRSLLGKGYDVNKISDCGDTALHNVCYPGQSIELLKLLLSYNCDIEKCNKHGLTPLSVACCHNNIEAVEILLSHGYKEKEQFDEPIGFVTACEEGMPEIVELLISYGCQLDPIYEEDTGLIKACGWVHVDIVKMLITNGCDIDKLNSLGNTALIVAADIPTTLWYSDCPKEYAEEIKRYNSIIELLLINGCDTSIRNKKNIGFDDMKNKIDVLVINRGFLQGGLFMVCIRYIKANIGKFNKNNLLQFPYDIKKYLIHYIKKL